jgi:DNA-directed RNA polymerase specialized sigma24 family protein
MDIQSLFRANVALIDRVAGEVCRRARMRDEDVEDFTSSVKLALLENDCAILRRWEGRSTLAGYLSVVIRRLLQDHRTHELGRWRPSAEARRMGEAGVLLDTLMNRDGRALDDALPLACAADPSLSRSEVVAMASRLPSHQRRPRLVELEEGVEAEAADRADSLALARDAGRIAGRAGEVVCQTIAQWSDEDVMILRFRFGSSLSIADIARMLRVPQRPLYRRIESMLAALRLALTGAGFDATILSVVIGNEAQLDFGLRRGKNEEARQSIETGSADSERVMQ